MRRSSGPAVVLMLSLACLLLPLAWAAPPAGEQVEAPDAAATEKVERSSDFASLIGHVRKARETGEWRQANWVGLVDIEQSLTRLLEDAGRAAKRDDAMKVGMPLAEVRPGDVPRGRVAKVLHVAENIDIPFAEGCVLLADGGVRVSHASDCVIIAGGAVEVSHGQRNLIVAGHFVHVSHDGNGPRRGNPDEQGSLLVAGQLLDVAHASGSVCHSPGLVRISHANGVTFVNSPNVETSHRNGCRDAREADGFAAAPPTPPANPLADKLMITQVVDGGDARRGAMVVVLHDGVELVTRLGAEVVGPGGKPVEGLAGWKLSFVADDFALFRRGTETVGFVVPAKR